MISGLAQWVKDLASPQAQHRLQMQIGSGVAMAVVWAGGYSSELTPNLETSICCRFSSETEREKKKKKKDSDCSSSGHWRGTSSIPGLVH